MMGNDIEEIQRHPDSFCRRCFIGGRVCSHERVHGLGTGRRLFRQHDGEAAGFTCRHNTWGEHLLIGQFTTSIVLLLASTIEYGLRARTIHDSIVLHIDLCLADIVLLNFLPIPDDGTERYLWMDDAKLWLDDACLERAEYPGCSGG